MNNSFSAKVDTLIEAYRKDHYGEFPLYIVLSPADANRLIDDVRKNKNYDSKTIVTNYRDITIAKHDAFLEGKILLSNELPETGS
jgi:hypothetical protein